MLPTGHVAAGFLTSQVLLKVFPEFPQIERFQLTAWVIFFSFAPDLDTFWYFLKNKSFLVCKNTKDVNHRMYVSHAPVLWVVASLALYALSYKLLALALFFGSFSHFVLDSIEFGIMWLWPVNKKFYALKNTGVNLEIYEETFLAHTFKFLKAYSKTLTFRAEVFIILFSFLYILIAK